MATALFDIAPLLPLLADGATIVTPNKRLSSHIHRAYCNYLSKANAKSSAVMIAPQVYALGDWLQQQWLTLQYSDYAIEAGLIDDHQRHWLWQQVIRESDNDAFNPLVGLSLQKLARLADEAHRNLILWQVDKKALSTFSPLSIESQQLLQWISAFEKKLLQCHAITQEQIISHLQVAFEKKQLLAASHIHLQSFDDLPPLSQALLTQASIKLSYSQEINRQNTSKHHDNQQPDIFTTSNIRRTCAPNREIEIKASALWCWEILQRNANATIGIIVPDLGNQRDSIEQTFTEVFETHYLQPQVDRYPLPFNISTGTPLGQTPLISDTLQLLKLSLPNMALEDACHLLHSPFFGDYENEQELRAGVVTRLRRLQQSPLRAAQIRYCVEKECRQGIEDDSTENNLSNRLQQFETLSRQHRQQQHTAQQWADVFQQCLEMLGWPGQRPLDSVEYQQLMQWQELLEQFSTVDVFDYSSLSSKSQQSQLPLTTAIQLLEELANNTHFQTQIKASPIHILGTLEAAGLRFDHCWLLGFDNQRWPPKPVPNPLLPLELQRNNAMPRGSHERELRYAQSLTDGFLACSANIVVSYAKQDGDDLFEPSALIKSLPEEALAEIVTTESTLVGLDRSWQQLLQIHNLQLVADDYGPPLTQENNLSVKARQSIKGGTSILQQQANCPFNAFARKRLGAVQIDPPQIGLNAIERGNLLHSTMANIWNQLQNQNNLLELNDRQLQQLIKDCIQAAFNQELKYKDNILGPYYWQLEQVRLNNIVARWLQSEKQRPPFSVVASEQEYEADFDGIRYTLRIDRIDQLPSGKLLLIDYKSGSTAVRHWLEERPAQPQLPLYALTFDGKYLHQAGVDASVAGIAFAEINANNQRLLGIAELGDEESIQGLIGTQKALEKYSVNFISDSSNFENQSNFEQLKQYFARLLQPLSDEFRRGYAAVLFKNRTDASRIDADLLPLNRFAEVDYIQYICQQNQKESCNE